MDQLAFRRTEPRGTRVYLMSSSGRDTPRPGWSGPRSGHDPSEPVCLVGWCSTRYVGAPSRSVMWVGVTRVSTEIAETKAAVIGSGRTRV